MSDVKKPGTYAGAGVDIEKGDRLVEFIKGIKSAAVFKGIGGFSSGMEIDTARFKRPVILSTTDGVGTKLLIARELSKYDTVGIDLVAMCVNDLVVCGAEPVMFLDYIACGRIDEPVMRDIMRGIVAGCEQAGCVLSGGETAEMPDMYARDDFDLAGFAVGIAEKDRLIPKKEKIKEGDPVFGLASSGVHSNGFSLIRRVIPENDSALRKLLLTPTKIYASEMKSLLDSGDLLGAAHITGGGLEGNIHRIIPDSLDVSLDYNWEVPEVFDRIRTYGNIADSEMKKVFNLGIGLAVVTAGEHETEFIKHASSHNVALVKIGEVVRG